MLEAFSAPGRFWKGNLHGHSTRSDGLLSPEEACDAYRQAGYDFTVLTDHFRAANGFPITDTRHCRDGRFTTLIGAELHAPATALGVEWHILAVGLPDDFAPPAGTESGPALATRAAAAGAFVAIAHPHWYQLTLEDGISLTAAHAVEVYNHTCQVNADRGESLAFYDEMLMRGRRLTAIAVDDSHWRAPDAFGGFVMVKAERNDPDALLAALKAGRFYASQGPSIEAIESDGARLHVACTPAVSVIAVGTGRRTVREHGDGLTRVALPMADLEGGWCRVIVTDANGRRAWTNPLWRD